MCGIAAIVSKSKLELRKSLKKMTDSISHRGPDGEGHWIDSEQGVCLGHRRLSIIDLSNFASQPMTILDRYVITFNGEIYNYIELKDKIEQYNFKFQSNSDTEVLLYYYHLYREKCLDYLEGMFSFIIYDKLEKRIFGARDRFGEKPLYYHYDKVINTYYFASEIKQFWALGISKSFKLELLYNFIDNGITYNPNDLTQTFFEDINKIGKSQYFIIDHDNCMTIQDYWALNIDEKSDVNLLDSLSKLEVLLKDSVSKRMRSDVPIGSSLSGGLDSSLIVSLINSINKSNPSNLINTFSARFKGFAKDESKYQDIVLSAISAKEHFVTPNDDSFLNKFSKVAYFQDEPFPSASINTQYEVYEAASQCNTKVLLDGQGADEVFAGYYYFYKSMLNGASFSQNKSLTFDYLRFIWNQMGIKPLTNLFLRKVKCSETILDVDFNHYSRNASFGNLSLALLNSTLHGPLEELLRIADRNSMAHSVEVRLPYLDSHLVEYVFSLNDTYKLNGIWTKWILRKVAEKHLDPIITWRKDKIGFEAPQSTLVKKEPFIKETKDLIEELKTRKILKSSTKFESINDENLLFRLFILGKFL